MDVENKKNLIDYFLQLNLIPIIIAGITSNALNPILKSIIYDVFMPCILFDFNKDGVPDLQKYKNKKFNIGSISIRYGMLLFYLLEALLTALFFVLLSKFIDICKKTYINYLVIH